MDTVLREIRQGARFLAKSRGFTLVAAATLALGIGANTAIFSVINALLLRPLPYPDSGALVMVWSDNRTQGWDRDLTSYPNYQDWKQYSELVGPMAAFTGSRLALTQEGEPEQIPGAQVSSAFFSVMGVEPRLGRGFAPEEEQKAFSNVIVLGHELWNRRFGGDPSLVGRTIPIRGEKYVVVGVMPPGFDFPAGAQAWVPLAPSRMDSEERRFLWLQVVGRLKPGAHLAKAQAEMKVIGDRLERLHPLTNAGLGINLVPLHEDLVGNVRPALLLLFAAVFCVLLIACSNVANLLLARGAARSHEVAVRAALGASRRQIVRQHLIESVLLGLLGGGLGVLLASWGVPLLVTLIPPDMPRVAEITVDGPVLAFAAFASLITGLLFGLLPALRAAKLDPSTVLKDGKPTTAGGLRRGWTRQTLVSAEIAVALVLLIGTGLLAKSILQLQSVNPGFRTEGILAAQLLLPAAKYPNPAQMSDFYAGLVERVRTLPGVQQAAVASTVLDGEGSRSDSFTVEGQPPVNPEERIEVTVDTVTPGFFSTLGIPLVQGRDFGTEDNPQSVPVVIVNAAFARRFLPEGNPVGKRIKYGGPQTPDPWMQIVGVVGDVHRSGLDQEVRPATYRPHSQAPFPFLTLVVRTDGEPMKLANSIRDQVWTLDRGQPINRVASLDEMLGGQSAQRRFNTLLLALMSALALVLAAVGTYGVVSYLVGQGRHEIGVRLALGAQSTEIFRLILGYGLRLASAGVVTGLVLAVVLTRWMGSQLFAVSTLDPVVFLGVSAVLLAIAVFASYLPARKAMQVDPVVTLRSS
ncbi:MAG: ABC transporter permease [Acidobacteriota bacterium]